MKLTHKERLERILGGQEIDRPAISAWRHFYNRENSKEDLVRAMIDFQMKFDWDFMKINPRASYFVEGWGAKLHPSTDPLVKPTTISLPIVDPSDWAKIRPLPVNIGALGEMLDVSRELVGRMGAEVHILPTIFSPMSIAGDLVDGERRFVELLRSNPVELHLALEAITATFEEYVKKQMDVGVAGIFFATTEWASRSLLTEEEYLEFGKPYDLRVLGAARKAVFNILHVCNKNNMLPLFRDYPAQVLSWNPFDEGNLSIHQAAQIFDNIFLSGMDHNVTLLSGSPPAIKRQIETALQDAPPGKLIVGPGCAVKVKTPDNHLMAAAETVKGWRT
jgi:uroporphyrinogen decarboxylase